MRHPDGSLTVSYKVEFTRGQRGRKVAAPVEEPKADPKPAVALRPVIDPSSIPRLTRLLVLGYHFERLVREGKVKNYAEIARLTGLSRARVTQIVNLTLLSRGTQESALLVG